MHARRHRLFTPHFTHFNSKLCSYALFNISERVQYYVFSHHDHL